MRRCVLTTVVEALTKFTCALRWCSNRHQQAYLRACLACLNLPAKTRVPARELFGGVEHNKIVLPRQA